MDFGNTCSASSTQKTPFWRGGTSNSKYCSCDHLQWQFHWGWSRGCRSWPRPFIQISPKSHKFRFFPTSEINEWWSPKQELNLGNGTFEAAWPCPATGLWETPSTLVSGGEKYQTAHLTWFPGCHTAPWHEGCWPPGHRPHSPLEVKMNNWWYLMFALRELDSSYFVLHIVLRRVPVQRSHLRKPCALPNASQMISHCRGRDFM